MADFWFVGVAVEDCGESGGSGVEVEVLDVVKEIEVAAGEGDYFSGGESGAGALGVDVAANGGDGGDLGELAEDFGVAYVAEVEDVVGAFEEGEQFGAEKAVSVGEDADSHDYIQENETSCAARYRNEFQFSKKKR